MLLPWNGGVSSLRLRRWSAPSRANTEPEPSIRRQVGLDVAHIVGVGHEQSLGQLRVRDNDGPAEQRDVHREHVAVAAGQLPVRPRPRDGVADALQPPWAAAARVAVSPRGRWQRSDSRVALPSDRHGCPLAAMGTSLMTTPSRLAGTTMYRRCDGVRYRLVPAAAQGLSGGEMTTALGNGAHVARRRRPVPRPAARRAGHLDRRAWLPRHHRRGHRPARPHLQAHLL